MTKREFWKTKGSSPRHTSFVAGRNNDHYATTVVETILKKVFRVHPTLLEGQQIEIFYDKMDFEVKDRGFDPLDGVIFLGVLYKDGDFGHNVATHLFIRETEMFMGPLNEWKDDIKFPEGVTGYSVFAVWPLYTKPTSQHRTNINNKAVKILPRETLDKLDIQLGTLMRYIVNDEFMVEKEKAT